MKNRWFYSGSVVALAAAVAAVPTANADEVQFSDVKLGNEQAEAIQMLVEKGIISGFPDGTFRPNENVTRGQAAKIIAGVLDVDLDKVKNPGFSDVKEDHMFYKHIAALANLEIIHGSNGQFKPDDKMTRGQMAKVLAIAFDLKGSDQMPFKDVNVESMKEYVSALFESGVTKGVSEEIFGFNDAVTRGQLTVFVKRIQELESNQLPKIVPVLNEYGVATIMLPTLEEGQQLKYRFVPGLVYTPLYEKGTIAPDDLKTIRLKEAFNPWLAYKVQLYKVDANNKIIDAYQLIPNDTGKFKAFDYTLTGNTLTIKTLTYDLPIELEQLYIGHNEQVFHFSKGLAQQWKKDVNGIPTLEIQLPSTFNVDANSDSIVYLSVKSGEYVDGRADGFYGDIVNKATFIENEKTVIALLKEMNNKLVMSNHSTSVEMEYIASIVRTMFTLKGYEGVYLDNIYLIYKYIDAFKQTDLQSFNDVKNVVVAINDEHQELLQKVKEAEKAVMDLFHERYFEMPVYERLKPTTTKEDVLAAEKLLQYLNDFEAINYETHLEYLVQEAKIAIGLDNK